MEASPEKRCGREEVQGQEPARPAWPARLAWMRVLGVLAAASAACGPARSGAAQAPATVESPELPSRQLLAAGAVLLAASTAFDGPLRALAAREQSRLLGRVAVAVDPLGRAQYLVPALVGAYVIPRIAGKRVWADAALRIGLGYAAADGLAGVVRYGVGRHRPDSTGRPWRFRPLRGGAGWDSFPSGHATHAFAIAAALSEETNRRWVAEAGYAAATLVGVQRVYRQAHWASDVVGTAAVAVVTSKFTVRWLDRRGLGWLLTPKR